MNMMTPEEFVDLKQEAATTENPALKQMLKQWEKKIAKNALRAGGFGLMAVSLAACDSNSSAVVAEPPPVIDPPVIDPPVIDPPVIDPPVIDPPVIDPPVPVAGTWSLVAGGLQLSGDFDPALFAGGPLPAGVLIGNPAVLTPTTSNFVQGEGLPGDADDLVLASSDSFLGALINLAGGSDTIFISVTGSTVSGLVTNAEVIELANIATNSDFFDVISVVNLSNVVDINKVIISETSVAADAMQVTGIRNTATIELQGNFNNDLFIDFLNATGPLNLILNDYFQNGGSLDIAQDFSTVNLTSAGEGSLNAFDSNALGDNLQTLNIDGSVDLEIIDGTIDFRGNTQAVIDASGFTGENLSLTLGNHNNVAFTGSAANDLLEVSTARATVGTDFVITLTADFGAGDNTLIVTAGGGGVSFVTAESSIASEGELTLFIGSISTIDMTQLGAAGVSAFTDVIIGQGSNLLLTAAQVNQIGIENFSTPVFAGATGQLSITGVDGEPLDLSDIEVGTLVNIITVPGDVVLSAATVLGNANAGVQAVIVDNRGTDSTVTMTAIQFQQLSGPGTVTSYDLAISTDGTNNPATGEAYETGLVLTDLDTDTAYNLNQVSTTTTDIQLTNFTAGAGFALNNAGATELTLTLSGAVNLVEAGQIQVDNLVYAAGAVLTTENGQINVTGDTVFEGAATINNESDGGFVAFNTNNIVGDASQVVVNFTGTGNNILQVAGQNDLTLGAVNTVGGVTPQVTLLTIQNNLNAGATLGIAGGSPDAAITLGEDTITLNVVASANNITLIGTDPSSPDIVSSTLTTINANTQGNLGAIIDLGDLSGITSAALTVNGFGVGTTTVEISVVPAGAAWVFNGVDLVIDSVAGFGAGATITLGPNTTLSGDATISDIAPFLTSDSIVPLDSTSTAAEIDAILQALEANQATVDVTGMNLDQLQAVINNSLKVNSINGDLVLTADLTPFEINTLSGLYNQGLNEVLTINAAGMTAEQKEASAFAVGVNNTTVVNLTLDAGDVVFVIETLLAQTAINSTVVNATEMDAGQLNALVADIVNVNNITGITLTVGNNGDQITALLSKAVPQSVTVDAEFMDNDQFAAIVQQITKIAVDGITNLTVTAGIPAQDFQADALLELAVDANVDAFGMSAARLSIVAENIDNIVADGIINLTVTAEQTAVEIAALVSKAPDGSVVVDLSGMSAEQVDAVSDAAVKVLSLTVGEDSSVTLTLAQFAELQAVIPAPLLGTGATGAENTGGSITIVADVNGTLDLLQVAAGASDGVNENGGTLTLQIEAGVTLTVTTVTGVLQGQNENLSITGGGTLAVTGDLDLSGQNLSVAAGVTILLAAADPGITLTLTPEQADALALDGVTVIKAAAILPAVEGEIRAFGGDSGDAEPQDLSALDLSLVDVLVLEDGNGTILSSSAAALPAQIGIGFSPVVLVPEDTDWSAYEGFFQADISVNADATVTVSAATASQSSDAGSFIIGANAAVAGETGGSIIITSLENGEVYNLSGNFTPGGDGAVLGAFAGTFVVSIAAEVILEAGTTLPTSAEIVIDAGATLTVNGGSVAENQNDNFYEGLGTLNFIDLNGNTVTADEEVRFTTFTFEATDINATINDFESIDIGGFNGRFLFDETTDPDTLGTMSLDLSAFVTNGAGYVNVADLAALNALGNVSNTGVIVIEDGADPVGANLSLATGGDDAQLFFASEIGADTRIEYWDDASSDGIVDLAELTLVATLTNTGTDQLGSENFTL